MAGTAAMSGLRARRRFLSSLTERQSTAQSMTETSWPSLSSNAARPAAPRYWRSLLKVHSFSSIGGIIKTIFFFIGAALQFKYIKYKSCGFIFGDRETLFIPEHRAV